MKGCLKLLSIYVLAIQCLLAQAENDKSVILKNRVKTSQETLCFTNSTSSCSVIFEEYDQQGNLITWDMSRLGTRYQYLYDFKNRKIATLWINKNDTTKIDTLKFVYDTHNNIIKDYNDDIYENKYDHKNRLIKQTPVDVDAQKDKLYTTFKTYEYDLYDNLIREIHYENNEITNTICYDYDANLRLILKTEYNESRIKLFNKEYAEYKEPIKYFLTKITYDKKDRIKETYEYYSDPCMSLENYFTFKYSYRSSNLLNNIKAFRNGRHVFTINYEYSYY